MNTMEHDSLIPFDGARPQPRPATSQLSWHAGESEAFTPILMISGRV